MYQTLLGRLVADERAVPYQADDPFTLTYFEFLRYFQDLPIIKPHHVIISTNFTYGWMPTMLKLRHTDFQTAAHLLNRAKQREALTNSELAVLAALINNSLVGVSKVLHFVNPQDYPIWDSRVYRYLYGNKSQYHLHAPQVYQTHVQTCRALALDAAFMPVHQSINQKMGRPVTPVRAVEVIMYTGGSHQAISTLQTREATQEV